MSMEPMPDPSAESKEGEPRRYRIFEGGAMGGSKITIAEIESAQSPKEILIEYMTNPDSNVRGIVGIEDENGETIQLTDKEWDEVQKAIREHQRKMYEQSQE